MARKSCKSTESEEEVQSTGSGIEQGTASIVVSKKTHHTSSIQSGVYKACYLTGATLFRQAARSKRRMQKGLLALMKRLQKSTNGMSHFKALAKKAGAEVKAPLDEGFAWSMKLSEEYHAAVKAGEKGAFIRSTLIRGLRTSLDVSSRAFNYAAPIAGLAVLALTVGVYNNLTIGLKVEYDGQFIGYVRNESEFNAADQRMQERIMFEDYVFPEDAIPRFTLTFVDVKNLTSEDELTNQIIMASGNELKEAVGLYIDNRFVGATTDGSSMDEMLEDIKTQYVTGDPDETVDFVQSVEHKEGLYPLTSIVDVRSLKSEVEKNESEQRVYVVQKGDAPTLIAQKFNMAYSDLKRLNPNIEKALFVGQDVIIQKSVPRLEVKVIKKEVYNEDVPFTITQIQDPNKYVGYTKVSQVGQKGLNEITSEVVYVNGVEESRTIVETKVLKAPVEEEMIVGGLKPLSQIPVGAKASGNFIWPVDGGRYSCGFYGYYNHGGMDIAASAGTGVRASASGTVEIAQQYTVNAYGKYVIINHGGGVKTLYAHNSAVYVTPGQWVEQGQLIAAIGRTGNATGNHCHFEIRVNGVQKMPENYIGKVYNR